MGEHSELVLWVHATVRAAEHSPLQPDGFPSSRALHACSSVCARVRERLCGLSSVHAHLRKSMCA
eukprot:4243670-Pleurochrysis_carterae.AAC.2